MLGAMEITSDLSAGGEGVFHHRSANPFEFFHILTEGDSLEEQTVFGTLLLPEKPASLPMPAIIACHGSLDWRPHHQEYIARFLEQGIAVWRVHSFEPRGVTSIVEDQMQVTMAMLLCDAFGALRLLQSHPQIDGERVGVTGWSLGGSVALYSAWEPLAEALAPGGERFAAHLPIYPAAHIVPLEKSWSKAPIRNLIGADDDYTPAHFVEDFVADLAPRGVNIDAVIYPDAHHSYDSIEPVEYLPGAVTAGHRTIQMEADGTMWVEGRDGVRFPMHQPEHRQQAIRNRKSLGGHIGRNWAARRQSFADAEAFFAEHLLDT
jgi:dienelactone hydrolase